MAGAMSWGQSGEIMESVLPAGRRSIWTQMQIGGQTVLEVCENSFVIASIFSMKWKARSSPNSENVGKRVESLRKEKV